MKSRSLTPLLVLAALAAAFTGTAQALPEEGPIFTTTGEDCRNFTVSLDGSMDAEVAREMTPERFTPVDPPSGFVEMATCPSGKVNGVEIGAYTIAEAAIAIEAPADIDGTSGPVEQDIYALSQLDTNAVLSGVKSDAGYRSEVIDIGFDYTPGPPQRIEGTIPWPFSPYTMEADLIGGVPIPGVSLITRIWTAGPKGVVVTENNIFEIAAGSTGVSTAHFEPGSPLAKLAGADTVTGPSISGVGTFENRAFLIEEGAKLKAKRIRRGRAVKVKVRGIEGPFVGVIRRGADGEGRHVKTRKSKGNKIFWAANDRSKKKVRRGSYAMTVKLAETREEAGKISLKVRGNGRIQIR